MPVRGNYRALGHTLGTLYHFRRVQLAGVDVKSNYW